VTFIKAQAARAVMGSRFFEAQGQISVFLHQAADRLGVSGFLVIY
jgi:hypothetical protein